ncbi:iron-containing alcohol dehydrogenase [Limimaricola sp. G21655-S1]|uniref:iron-containing alcohol dehydrogenase n=1 Tax=Limimaricola sp. G21655-S1 TaxID=3014768 RepID=UPI0022AF4CF9|nr:iron-containing alcohol dehydrogenase [Limimaricola sp. G21655-S1]MCZ4259486.1 iron-containing alcohol dehydrogenase [Limimaricola sp. G21655-S1]
MNGFEILTAGRVVFGRGRAEDAGAAIRAWGTRVILLRGSHPAADRLAAELRAEGVAVEEIRQKGEPLIDDLDTAVARGRALRAEAVVALGGGSAIDMGKAVAALIPAARPAMSYLEVVGEGRPLDAAPLPFMALPTTAGTGAEVTKNAVIGVPAHGRKVSLRDDRMLADLAIIDPSLTDDAPRFVTLASGLDAVTQVIEPYLSCRATPFTDALCRDAIPRGLAALTRLMQAEDEGARDDLALTSLFGGLALANAGLGAVHGFAGVLGGRTGAPHGALCGRLLPGVLRANADAVEKQGGDITRHREVASWIAVALDVATDPLDALEARITEWGLPRLTEMGVAAAEIPQLAKASRASSSMQGNPVDLSQEALETVLRESL